MSDDFFVSRQKAAQILGVSTRTIDRYIAQEKFSVLREDGKVLLDSRELHHYKKGKNPVVAQMVSSPISVENVSKNSALSKTSADVLRYKTLYEDIKNDVSQKEELLREMHYKLGVLETKAESSIPVLEAENEKTILEETLESATLENQKIKATLQSARNGQIFFFILSLVFLLLILAIFIIQDGNIFQVS